MRPAFRVLVLGAVAWLPFGGVAQAATPLDTLRAFFDRANAIIMDPDPARGLEERRDAIRALANELFDFRAAAALALGREWTQRTAAEQAEFTRLFAGLLENGYLATVASRARVSGGVTIGWIRETVEGATARVATTVLTRSGGELPVEYRMVRRGERWAVRDVLVDGLSLAGNYHAQFQRVIQAGSYTALLARMRARAGVPERAPAMEPPTAGVAPAPPAPAMPAPADPSSRPGVQVAAAIEPLASRLDAEPAGVRREPRRLDPAPPPAPAVVAAVAPESAARPAPREPSYWVQVGAFRTAEAVSRLVERLDGHPVTITSEPVAASPDQAPQPLSRVLVGPFPTRAQAATTLRDLEAHGHRPFLTTTPN